VEIVSQRGSERLLGPLIPKRVTHWDSSEKIPSNFRKRLLLVDNPQRPTEGWLSDTVVRLSEALRASLRCLPIPFYRVGTDRLSERLSGARRGSQSHRYPRESPGRFTPTSELWVISLFGLPLPWIRL